MSQWVDFLPWQFDYTYGDEDVISAPAGFLPYLVDKTPINVFFTVISLNSAKFDDVISVLICISSVEFYRVLQYKHFEVWLVVLWFTVLEITTIFLSPTPKLSPCLSSERRTLWRHFWSYCQVTKSLPSLFCYATWSSSWKWRETSHTFFAHGDPLSDWTIHHICQCNNVNV